MKNENQRRDKETSQRSGTKNASTGNSRPSERQSSTNKEDRREGRSSTDSRKY